MSLAGLPQTTSRIERGKHTFWGVEILVVVLHPVLHAVAVRLRMGGLPVARQPHPLQLLYEVDVGGALVLLELAGWHRLPLLLRLQGWGGGSLSGFQDDEGSGC